MYACVSGGWRAIKTKKGEKSEVRSSDKVHLFGSRANHTFLFLPVCTKYQYPTYLKLEDLLAEIDTSTSPPSHVAKSTFDAQSAPPTLCGHGNMGGVKSAWASTKKSVVYAFAASAVPMCMHSFHANVSDAAVQYVCHNSRARPIRRIPSDHLFYWRYAAHCS